MEMKEVNLDKPVYEKLAKAAQEKGWKKPEDYLADLILTRTDSRITIEPDILTVLERASIQLSIPRDKIVNYATLCTLEFDDCLVAAAGLFQGKKSEQQESVDRRRLELEKEISAAFETWKSTLKS